MLQTFHGAWIIGGSKVKHSTIVVSELSGEELEFIDVEVTELLTQLKQ
jgi:hypothetical protein